MVFNICVRLVCKRLDTASSQPELRLQFPLQLLAPDPVPCQQLLLLPFQPILHARAQALSINLVARSKATKRDARYTPDCCGTEQDR